MPGRLPPAPAAPRRRRQSAATAWDAYGLASLFRRAVFMHSRLIR